MQRRQACFTVCLMATQTRGLESLRLTPWPRDISLPRRITTFIEAFIELLWLDIYSLRGFKVLRQKVAETPVAARLVDYDALNLVRVAVRDACIFYIKPAHCLQRSSVVTRMLRRRAIPAELVIGYQSKPVAYHAWVEVEGRIAWDHKADLAFYTTVDRV